MSVVFGAPQICMRECVQSNLAQSRRAKAAIGMSPRGGGGEGDASYVQNDLGKYKIENRHAVMPIFKGRSEDVRLEA